MTALTPRPRQPRPHSFYVFIIIVPIFFFWLKKTKTFWGSSYVHCGPWGWGPGLTDQLAPHVCWQPHPSAAKPLPPSFSDRNGPDPCGWAGASLRTYRPGTAGWGSCLPPTPLLSWRLTLDCPSPPLAPCTRGCDGGWGCWSWSQSCSDRRSVELGFSLAHSRCGFVWVTQTPPSPVPSSVKWAALLSHVMVKVRQPCSMQHDVQLRGTRGLFTAI